MNRRCNRLLATAVVVLVAGVAWAQETAPGTKSVARAYTLTKLGTLGGKFSDAVGISADGQIAGNSDLPNGDQHAFLYANGKMRDIGTLGGARSDAFGISADGQVVGGSDINRPIKTKDMHPGEGIPDSHVFVYKDGHMQDLGALMQNGPAAHAEAVNRKGQVVGEAETGPWEYGGFIVEEGKMKAFPVVGPKDVHPMAINDLGDVVGSVRSGVDPHAFLLRQGKFQDLNTIVDRNTLAAAGFSYLGFAGGINEKGDIVGSGTLAVRGARGQDLRAAFLLTGGKLQALGTVGRKGSNARAINAGGQVVGTAGDLTSTSEADAHAVLWDHGASIDLNELIGNAQLGALGFKVIFTAQAINDRGQIVGTGLDLKGNRAGFLLTPK